MFFRGENYNLDEEMKEIVQRRDEKRRMAALNGGNGFIWKRLCSRAFWQPFSCIGVLYGLSQFSGIQLLQVYTANIFR